jgi:hypothetical protein
VLFVLYSVMMETVLKRISDISHVTSLSKNYMIQKRDANYFEHHGNTYNIYMVWAECRVRKYSRRWNMLSF